jgi:hypothetical protein
MPTHTTYHSLLEAVRRYFDLMFTSDTSCFDHVFAPSAQLHGLQDGVLRFYSAQEYKTALDSRPSPQSKNAPRVEEILLVDLASTSQALVKVRVRIDTVQYLDCLSYHLMSDIWLVTAKSFHIEHRYEA